MATTVFQHRRVQDIANLVLAAGLFFSPQVLGFAAEGRPAWNAWIIGVALGAITITTMTAFAEWEEWVTGILGLWLIIAPWALGFTEHVNAMSAHVALGALTAAVSGWAVWDNRRSRRATA
jgi:hypothetical protein